MTLSEEFTKKATREQLERITSAAHWLMVCTIDGCRTDVAWFDLEQAIADVEPVEEM